METTPLEIRTLEHVADRTWPTLERWWYDGWVLRASEGVTRRSNSMTALEPSTIDVAEKLDVVEGWFAARDLPTIVRTLPTDPDDLHQILDTRGYDRVPGAHTMTRPVGDATADPDVDITPTPDDRWLEGLSAFGDDRGRPDVMRAMLAEQPGAAYAVLEDRAIGMAAVHDGIVAVFNMAVAPDQRRRGLGTRVLDGLLAWGASQGAVQAMLQVHPANTGAIAFYEDAGFTNRYDYGYRNAP